MYTLRGLQYILQVYCYYAEVYVQYGHVVYKDLQIKLRAVYMQGTLKAAVYGILNCTDIAVLSEMVKVNVLHKVLSDFVRN